MIHTGKLNLFTQEEVLVAEESDITFFEKEWKDLSKKKLYFVLL